MKRRIAWMVAAFTVATSPLSAQDAQCTSAAKQIQDACQKTIDILAYMAPQLGTTIAGGNTTLGQGGALGGLPHFTVEVRGTALAGSLPKIDQVPADTGGIQKSAYNTSVQVLGFPAIDAAVGLFGGLPLGLTSIGGVDLLANVSYVPTVNANSISVTPKTNTQFGLGARVGLLQESILVPGVAFSFIHRGLPTTTITASRGSGANVDTLQIKDLSLTTNSWRLTASKSLILFGVAAGLGQDTYSSSTGVRVHLVRGLGPIGTADFNNNANPFSVKQKVTRTNAFADAYINILLVKLVGELGYVTGGTVNTYNTFSTAPDAARLFGAVGLRIGL